MKKKFIGLSSLVLLLLFIFISVNVKAEEKSEKSSLSQIEKKIQELYEDSKIPGLSLVTIVDGNVFIKNYGYADKENEKPVTSETLFELASCSKSFTALAPLVLEAEGLLNLDDPVSRYIPGFTVNYEGKAYQVTIRQLLHHTSGLPFSATFDIPAGNEKTALQEMVKGITGLEANHIPGEKFEYASINYDIVGAVVEKVAGVSFEEFMEQKVLQVLGLNSTSVGVEQNRKKPDMSIGYKNSFYSPRKFTSPIFRANNPAGYVVSNANDMARWLKIQMGLEQTPLDMQINKSHVPNQDLPPSRDDLSSYAMGWQVFQGQSGELIHVGQNPNYTTYVAFSPRKKIGIAVMANSNSNYTSAIGDYAIRTMCGEKDLRVEIVDDNIDRVASFFIIVMTIFLVVLSVYFIIVLLGIKKGTRRFEGITGRKIFQVMYGLIVSVPFLIGLKWLPEALANTTWESAVIWGPSTLPLAAKLFIVTLFSSFLVYFISLMFPHRNTYTNAMPYTVILSLLSGLAQAGALMFIINFLNGKSGIDLTVYYFGLTLFLYVMVTRVVGVKLTKITNRVVLELRMKLINKIFSSRFQQFEKINSGQIYATLNNDTLVIGDSTNTIILAISTVAIVLSIFIYLGNISFLSTMLVLGLIAVIAIVYAVVMKRVMGLLEKARDSQNVFMKLVEGMVQGYKELSLHRKVKNAYKKDMENVCEEFRTKRQRSSLLFVDLVIGRDAVIMLMLGIVSIGFATMFPGIRHHTFVSFVIVLLYMVGPVGDILDTLPVLMNVRVSWGRINRFLKDLPEVIDEKSDEKDLKTNSLESIKAKDIFFEYKAQDEHERFSVGPLNFEASKGEIVFIIGGNGSGKTTLAKLLLGLYVPENGNIEVDGKPIANNNLGEYFSVVFSDFHLFEKLYAIELDGRKEEFDSYLKLLDLEGKVELKDGAFSTTSLSGGQRKRLALLLSYMQNHPVYLFDEWAAGQDPDFRKFFYRELLPQLKERGKTIIAITHDDRYFDVADRIYKMDLGKSMILEA